MVGNGGNGSQHSRSQARYSTNADLTVRRGSLMDAVFPNLGLLSLYLHSLATFPENISSHRDHLALRQLMSHSSPL